MNRRGFLSGILAAGIAPAVVGSGILMPLGKVWVPPVNANEVWHRFHEAYKNDMLEQIERATWDVPVYGTGGLLINTEGVRALGAREIYKTFTADEIALKIKWADQCMGKWGR